MFDQTKAFFTPAVEFFKTGKAALLKGGDLSGFVAGTTKRAILVAAVGFASSASAAASVQFDRASASVPRVSNTVIERAAQPAVETAPSASNAFPDFFSAERLAESWSRAKELMLAAGQDPNILLTQAASALGQPTLPASDD